MNAFRLILTLGLLFSVAWAQPMTLEDMEARLSKELGKIQEAKAGQREDLKRKYLQALLRYESSTRQQGDLDALQAARKEIQEVEQSVLGVAAPTGPAELRQLRSVVNDQLGKFDKEAAEKVTAMVVAVERYAETRAAELTRMGEVPRALEWRSWGRDLRNRPAISSAFTIAGTTAPESNGEPETPKASRPKLLRKKAATPIATKTAAFPEDASLYVAGSEPSGDEKRVSASTPSAKGAGNSRLQVRVKLIEEDETLSRSRGYGSDYRRKSHLYVARIEFTPLPGQSMGKSLVVFDLYRRGTGSNRSVIRTDGVVIPPMKSNEKWVVDSGTYTYETVKYDSSWSSYDYEMATADEFYGFVVSIFDKEGNLVVQRATARALNELARTKVPDKLGAAR